MKQPALFMRLSFRMNKLLPVFAALAFVWPLASAPADTLAEGYQDMYNLNFSAAHKTFQSYEQASPADPMGPVSDGAAYLFYEFERLNVLRSEFFASNSSFLSMKRLKADPQVKRDFEAALAHGKALSEAMLKKDPNSREALLADVVRIALHADYLALIEKDNWDALQEVKQARALADALIQKYPDCYDAYLAEGVENYLLSQKPAPMRLFLRMTGAETDKQEGIKKLRVVAEKGHYLKPYAKILLAIAALRDEKRGEAVSLLKQLAANFPGNSLFRDELKKLCEPSLAACTNS
jgi:hypothetical protein